VVRVRAPSPALVQDYLRHLGADVAAYSKTVPTVPPHLWPHWSVPSAARALHGVPYRIVRLINGGCRLSVNAPIEAGAQLTVKARLVEIDDDGRRAVLRQQIITDTPSHPGAVCVDLYGIVPSGRSAPDRRESSSQKEVVRVPASAREVATFAVGQDDGLLFALLTGDFNPIHWSAPFARAAGFGRPILHGAATMARAMEGLARALYGGNITRIAAFDARFERPLRLGSLVGLYVGEDGRALYVADAPGGRPYLRGSFEEKSDG
jgi:acyl dehydratase